MPLRKGSRFSLGLNYAVCVLLKYIGFWDSWRDEVCVVMLFKVLRISRRSPYVASLVKVLTIPEHTGKPTARVTLKYQSS